METLRLSIDFMDDRKITHKVTNTHNEPHSYRFEDGYLFIHGEDEFSFTCYPLANIRRFWVEQWVDRVVKADDNLFGQG